MIKKNKIILVGDGQVGSSFAFASTILGVGTEIGIVDINKARTEGDALDLQDVLVHGPHVKVYAAEYKDCHDAEIVVITAGAAQKPGQTRLELIDINLKIMEGIVKEIMKSGFNGIFLVVSNPVDIMTYAVKKFSGFPKERVIGSGTVLDSARLRYALSEYLEVDPRNVHAYVMGEHGDSEFAAFSAASVAGLKLGKFLEKRCGVKCDKLMEIEDCVRHKAYEIINRKGATYYGIGTAMTRICKAILSNENAILSVSAYLEGEYGLKDVYLGTPCVINASGIREVLQLELDERETKAIQKSHKVLKDIIDRQVNKK